MPRKPFYRQPRFWMDTGERGVRAFGTSGLAAIGTVPTGLLQTDWRGLLSVALMGVVIEVLTCLKAGGTGDKGTAGFVKTEANEGD